MNSETCVEKVNLHLNKLSDEVKDNFSGGTDEDIILMYALVMEACKQGKGKEFCQFMDEVIKKENELGRLLTIQERDEISKNIFGK